MLKICNKLNFPKIRLLALSNLIFFALLLFSNCKTKPSKQTHIIWVNDRAISIAISNDFLKSLPNDSIKSFLIVRLKEEPNSIPVLGDIVNSYPITFQPLIPFSQGNKYQIYYKNRLIDEFEISRMDANKPKLISIFPGLDTLPENLLKVYLKFSSPMREGVAMKYIFLIHKSDTLKNVFLDLQPELWNEDRTILTLWLDPGRIKRNLIPNKKLGNPLLKGDNYSLEISNRWEDNRGNRLERNYNKKFVVSTRDSMSPEIKKWILLAPSAGTKAPLSINFKEPLDYYLVKECITIINNRGSLIKGVFNIAANGKTAQFIPNENWEKGSYKLQINPILEDLAGNNLKRVFDRDLKVEQSKTSPVHILTFNIY
jgi:hypothetical protein